MIIIIEGIDRVGKTTLANLISNKYDIPVFKQERIGGNKIPSAAMSIVNCGSMIGQVSFWNQPYFKSDIILDRFHWTEAVYSAVDRNNKIPMTYAKSIEELMSAHADKYVIIQVMPTDINWSSKQHGSDLSAHQSEFDALYDACSLNKYRCTHESYDEVLTVLDKLLNKGEKI